MIPIATQTSKLNLGALKEHSRVLITVDTEVRIRNRGLPDAFEVDVLGQAGGSAHGALWVAAQLKRCELRGVFFLDVHGRCLFGDSKYHKLCDGLLAAGHAIELHTHPDQAYDAKRRHMHEYSLEDQLKIVQDGIELLQEWTGTLPLAHRAGRYGANLDTLRALRQCGLYLDSSFFFGRADCQLPFKNTNVPFESEGVWELPVTVVPEPVEKLGYRLPAWTRHFWRHFQKLDVNCMTPRQLCDAVMELNGRVPYIVTFLHSFSFVRRENGSVLVDYGAIDSFQALLQLLVTQGIPTITFQDMAADLVRTNANELKEQTA